ncbi:MAG: hypothetical protein HYR85_23895 [Planctomycetes bacterium]|nr:hypothetical protein [Planctomycetota bacterium]MBI3847218.1 hypothetical protein [Planctomycetota bacterium]
MKKIAGSLSLVVALVIAGTVWARRSEPTDVDKLAWMAGAWGSDDGKVQMEEHWLPPKANAMLGLHREVRGDRMTEFEFLRIEKTKDGVVYFSMPQGRPATPFRLKEATDTKVVFENPEHDFPQRILYWLADGALHARIEGKPTATEAPMEWTWKRLPTAK